MGNRNKPIRPVHPGGFINGSVDVFKPRQKEHHPVTNPSPGSDNNDTPERLSFGKKKTLRGNMNDAQEAVDNAAVGVEHHAPEDSRNGKGNGYGKIVNGSEYPDAFYHNIYQKSQQKREKYLKGYYHQIHFYGYPEGVPKRKIGKDPPVNRQSPLSLVSKTFYKG
jgi:hypothetical protein